MDLCDDVRHVRESLDHVAGLDRQQIANSLATRGRLGHAHESMPGGRDTGYCAGDDALQFLDVARFRE